MSESDISKNLIKSQNGKNNKIGQDIICKHCGRKIIACVWNQVFCCTNCSDAYYVNRYSTNKTTLQKAKTEKNGCEVCGYNKWASCLEWHHVYPENKLYQISQMSSYPPEAIIRELAKCVLLCCNCHMELHRGRQETAEKVIKIMEQRQKPVLEKLWSGANWIC